MSEYSPETKSFGGKVKIELNLSTFPKKSDLRSETGVDTSKFDKKVDLAKLKSDVVKLDIDILKNVPSNLSKLKNRLNKLDVDKLVLVPVDLSKLSDAVINYPVKNDLYNTKIEVK